MRITDLESGSVYVVRQSFRDDEGTLVLPGDRMTFERYRAVPVTGGFEVTFREETLVLHEDRQTDVCEHAEWFLEDTSS
ncbi:MAG: hypothetical protein AAGK21_11895 [Bacteroidota bacterium]